MINTLTEMQQELKALPEKVIVKWNGRKVEIIENEDNIIIKPFCYKAAIKELRGKYKDCGVSSETLRQLNDEELVMEYGEERISPAFYEKKRPFVDGVEE